MGYLLDTDIAIDALRGHAPAQAFIRERQDNLAVSLLTVAELWGGVRNRREAGVMNEFLSLFPKIALTEEIAQKGGAYRNRYGKSHGTGIIDALLAATADAEKLTLATLNKKHYPMLGKIKIPYKK